MEDAMTPRRALLFGCLCLVLAASAARPAAQGPKTRGSAAARPAIASVPVPAVAREAVAHADPALLAGLRWRAIGPHRAGRTRAVAGVPGHPFTFYIGVCNGGVWKTNDAGRTWNPIFDDQPTGSIGWVAVAPSNPNVLYVGSGEGLPRPDLSTGDGIYKSIDAGRTWTHLGLRDGQQIPKIVVDPRNPDRLYVAVLGHPYGPNDERGVFRSSDGGRSFQKVLYKDENTGAKDIDIDPSNPDVLYATLWEQRQGPWENAAWGGTTGGIFKSVDGGTTWRQLTKGLPAGLTEAELAIAPSLPSRLYATVGIGQAGAIYRSDDSGESWVKATSDARPASRIDEAVPHVHPKDPDTLIVTNIVTWKSTDGGRTYVPFKGAPGGDDYQNLWFNPDDPNIILLVADQGAVVTLNGGETWSSWYNQPTAQFYHVMTDNAFPYRVCGGQQESGSACVASRGDDGQITFRDWHPVGVEEYGYVAPDPQDPDIVFGGKVTRYDRRTGQVSSVAPVAGGRGGPAGAPGEPSYRTVRTQPVVFSTVDRKTLFYANNYVWKTTDGGISWKRISPDLTRATWTPPASIGRYRDQASAKARQLGVVYTIGPSYRDVNRIWAGTDDGLIHTTADGGLHWTDVTPPQVEPFMKVFMIDPGRFDALTAYAAVNTLRVDDMKPHLFRTHDGGKTWTEIIDGLPDGAVVNTVREDPVRKGLLFAGTETQVYVSFDDGSHWQSLRLNMAPSSVRDLVVKDDDLVAATHGRGFWILDNITPLRQVEPQTTTSDAVLFQPAPALRVRWNNNTDTPLPPDEPTSPNPPEGASIDYYLKGAATGPVILEIVEPGGRVVRHYSSTDPVAPLPDPATNAPLPTFWYRPPQRLSGEAGMHRFQWDVHYQPLPGGGGGRGGLPIAAVPNQTSMAPTTPWVAPGRYTVRLTVNGKSHEQPIVVKADPRVRTPALVMQQVYGLSHDLYVQAADMHAAAARLADLAGRVSRLSSASQPAPVAEAIAAFTRKADALQGNGPGSLSFAASSLARVMNTLQEADVQPTASQLVAIGRAREAASGAVARWRALSGPELAALNTALKAAGLPEVR
jgi:photosystem II stability/assembly factor-like uncharacterized protein